MPDAERATRSLVLVLTLLAAGGAAAQPFPTYVSCGVPASRLGTSLNGFQAGTVGFLSDDPSPDLVLIDASRVAVELTDSALWAQGSCPEAIVETRPIDVIGAQGVTLVEADAIVNLGITVQPSTAALYLGDGSGSFAVGPLISTLDEVGAITAARLDGDSQPELIVAASNTVVVLRLNTATAAYEVAQTLTVTGGNVKLVAAAPLNADGRVDVVAADVVGNVHIFLQDASGMLVDQGPPATGSLQVAGAVAMQIVDVDNDTTPDLVFAVSDGASGSLAVYRGTQQPRDTVSYTLSQTLPAGADPSALGVGNLNGGGPLDAVISDRAASQIRLYRGNGTGFDPPQAPLNTGPSPNGLLLADLDRDGRDDIVATNAGDGSLTVFLSSQPPPTPTFTPVATAIDTLTPTATPTATPTGTATATPSDTPTATPTGTFTASVTPTTSRTPTASPTVTCVGFCVQGQGCADIAGGGHGGRGAGAAMPLVVLAALVLLRRLHR